MNAIRQFLKRIKTHGVRRPDAVRTVAMGIARTFDAYDLGNDTFIFERGIGAHLSARASVLVVEKSALRRRARGRVLTLTTGNHSVAAFPLLDGRFWKLSSLKSAARGEVLMHRILCANVTGDTIELSQRELPTSTLVKADDWLIGTVGFTFPDIVMGERNETTLEFYRRLGQEWRVKPLAWTENEMRVALAAAKKRIGTSLTYYHSTRGVHWLTYSEFVRFSFLAETDPPAFLKGLKELVGVYEGNRVSFMRLPKYRGHHEIEFFGLLRGVAGDRLVPEIERLMEAVALNRLGQLGVIQRVQEIVALYRSLLARSTLADESSKDFIETLYMHITGEVYSVVGEGTTPAFDDRRTALPGATFVEGRPVLHPGADSRTEILVANLRGFMSKDETVEYANVYELRTKDEDAPLGKGDTREIVYKTSRRPLENSLVEKRLAGSGSGYSGYLLSRIGALRSLGIALSDYYQLLKHRPGRHHGVHEHYIRRRCEGEPMDAIPANYFQSADGSGTEEKEVVLSLSTLMGDAAAQNLVMKKFDAATRTPLYGVGKEIYEFEYDLVREMVVPKRVTTCSVRGSFGWPDLSYTDANLDAIANFYLGYFAHAVKAYQARHPCVTMAEVAERFMSGFEFRIHALEWQLSVMRDRFEAFNPDVPARYQFAARWKFVLWSLERHARRLPRLRKLFFEKVRVIIQQEDRPEDSPGWHPVEV